MPTDTRDLLLSLARSDERSVRAVLTPNPEFAAEDNAAPVGQALDRRTRVLVRVAALLAVDAPTTSLRWAVDLASSTGISDEDVLAALVAAGSAAGSAQLVASAPRLALALGFDVELDGWDGS
jgi:4-carboxymuconolactone decarboxylase